MEGLTRALAVELAPIRVNIVSPGVVKSPLWSNMTEADRDALYRQTGERLPVGHVGEPEEIAEAYLYLMRQGLTGTGQVLASTAAGRLFEDTGGGVFPPRLRMHRQICLRSRVRPEMRAAAFGAR